MSLSTTTITIPTNYGYVLLSSVIVIGFIIPMYLGSAVMDARKKYNVPYPNLYATPGYHKDADAFNRVQRGHQNMFESLSSIVAMALIGGIKYPIACCCLALCYGVGNILYLKGYADTTLDVKSARYKKGGMLKQIGILGLLICSISEIGTMSGWW
jgi:glutathione S-transferase